jgi:hypothetical protein
MHSSRGSSLLILYANWWRICHVGACLFYRHLDFVSKFCHTHAPSVLPPSDYIGGKRKPMRRIGSHIVALSAAASRPDYRPGGWRLACAMISGGFLSQENQPEQGLTKPD